MSEKRKGLNGDANGAKKNGKFAEIFVNDARRERHVAHAANILEHRQRYDEDVVKEAQALLRADKKRSARSKSKRARQALKPEENPQAD